jgi:hypothetical protein
MEVRNRFMQNTGDFSSHLLVVVLMAPLSRAPSRGQRPDTTYPVRAAIRMKKLSSCQCEHLAPNWVFTNGQRRLGDTHSFQQFRLFPRLGWEPVCGLQPHGNPPLVAPDLRLQRPGVDQVTQEPEKQPGVRLHRAAECNVAVDLKQVPLRRRYSRYLAILPSIHESLYVPE